MSVFDNPGGCNVDCLDAEELAEELRVAFGHPSTLKTVANLRSLAGPS